MLGSWPKRNQAALHELHNICLRGRHPEGRADAQPGKAVESIPGFWQIKRAVRKHSAVQIRIDLSKPGRNLAPGFCYMLFNFPCPAAPAWKADPGILRSTGEQMFHPLGHDRLPEAFLKQGPCRLCSRGPCFWLGNDTGA